MNLTVPQRCLAALGLAVLIGCSNPARVQGVGASIASDTLAPSLSFSLGRGPTGATKPLERGVDQISYFRGDPGRAPDLTARVDEPCTAGCTPPARDWLLEEPLSAHRDFDDFGPSLGRDLQAHATWETVGLLLAGGAASLAVRETLDDDVDDWTAESPNRWGDVNDGLSVVGNPAHHFAAAAALWGTSLAFEDPELHSLSGSMMNALVITGASTLLLKLIADSDSPNGESLGWPSGHTASSVTMAAVLDEYYGPWVGVPAYLVAGAVAWERIDDREHDLSDVVFGAALGYAVGKVVARNHLAEQARLPIVPYVNPLDGSPGVGLEMRY